VTTPTSAIESRITELRDVTRRLNLHVPPSYFATSSSYVPYEDAIEPIMEADGDRPLHLYIGVPLCEEHYRFCMYFYRLVDAEGDEADACVNGLVEYLDVIAQRTHRRIAALYVGGGTPSVLAAHQIDRLMHSVNATFEFEPGSQRTFEFSPRSATQEKLAVVAACGIGRVSFGVQSFDPEPLRRAGRAYIGPTQIASIIQWAQGAGIDELNVDLMVGLDGETDSSLVASVELLLAMGCPTISIYRYRPGRFEELNERGGLDSYVAMCADRVARAVDIATNHGREVSGRIDGEHIRLIASGGCRWSDRNLYETRFRSELGNSLVGIGSAARSFLHDQYLVSSEHRAADGFELRGRPVLVEECNQLSRVAAAVVNTLFRDFTADLASVERTVGVRPESLLGEALDYLVEHGVLRAEDRQVTVVPVHRPDWAYWDKLLYPLEWIEQRKRSTRLRVR